jgi:hypothetical protein
MSGVPAGASPLPLAGPRAERSGPSATTRERCRERPAGPETVLRPSFFEPRMEL